MLHLAKKNHTCYPQNYEHHTLAHRKENPRSTSTPSSTNSIELAVRVPSPSFSHHNQPLLQELWATDATFQVTPPPVASETLQSSIFILLFYFMISSLFSKTAQVPPPRSCPLRPRLPEGVSPEFTPGLHSSMFAFCPWWSAAPSASCACTRRCLGAPGNPCLFFHA